MQPYITIFYIIKYDDPSYISEPTTIVMENYTPINTSSVRNYRKSNYASIENYTRQNYSPEYFGVF